MDPALPGFSSLTTGTENRLDSGDAEFVDVIHTCAGVFGIAQAVGHVDFYPNSGFPPQPGTKIDAEQWQSHYRAVEFFSESINASHEFWGHSCRSWQEYCSGLLCSIPTTLMGDPVRTNARGTMFLSTKDTSPYALGYV